MAGITLAQAQEQLDAWLTASTAVARNQSYRIDSGAGGSRQLTRADAAEIRANITYWQGRVDALTPASAGGRRRIRYVVPQ
jgi:hypothetical protein